mmetsp:Transcript_10358/g.35919  ORF Transcript_10358/g.35919 Transcript_10358/m.35919 type:complete len:215 (-) Transcript_10358:672-1316(-)
MRAWREAGSTGGGPAASSSSPWRSRSTARSTSPPAASSAAHACSALKPMATSDATSEAPADEAPSGSGAGADGSTSTSTSGSSGIIGESPSRSIASSMGTAVGGSSGDTAGGGSPAYAAGGAGQAPQMHALGSHGASSAARCLDAKPNPGTCASRSLLRPSAPVAPRSAPPRRCGAAGRSVALVVARRGALAPPTTWPWTPGALASRSICETRA